MDFLYTIDPNADEPIMLIDRHIGMDEEDGEGIMGDKFSRELMFLDTLNKSKINIWINSPGGSVPDGQQIYATILKTKTKVDTHNVGMAASIAFPIFLAGRNRYMMNTAVAMMHPVSGGDDKAREAFEKAVVEMLSSRSFISESSIKNMMAATTWLDAYQCRDMGLCNIDNAGEMNNPRKSGSIKDDWKEYRKILNKAIDEKKYNMSDYRKVCNKLNLVEGSTPEAMVAAIEKIEAQNRVSSDRVAALEKEMKEAEEKYNKLANELKEAKEKAANEARVAAENNAKNDITAAVKAGKIKNEAAVIETWTKNYLSNPEGTKAMIESMPSSKKGANLGSNSANANDEDLTSVIAKTMAEARNKFKI